jgi:two-component system phosphate regulon sensor histidine kinase PhoR
MRIHHALFAGFLGVVGLLVILVVLLVGTGLRQQLVGLLQDQLTRELRLAVVTLEVDATLPPDSLADVITGSLGYRTTIIDTAGVVLADSDVSERRIPLLENHADRPEIVQSWATGSVAFSERESATIGQRLLYAAVPATLAGEPVTLRIAASLAQVDATVRRLQRAVALTGFLAMLVALGVAYLLSRALARPLVVLSRRAAELAAGDFSRSAPRSMGVAELDELSLSFNTLADELQVRLAELGRDRDEMRALIDTMAEGVIALTDDARVLRTNRAARDLLRVSDVSPFAPVGTLVRNPELRELLERSVTQGTQARELQLDGHHLIVASRMLDQGGSVTTLLDVSAIRRLERVRRDFVANASHELKTPLTSIRGFAETLLEEDPPDELRARFLRSIRDNTLRLQLLVDDLLDLSRLESGGWVPRLVPLALGRVAEAVWQDFAEGAEEKDVAFGVEGDCSALADEQGMEQIFRNLFDNALRHTPPGGSVEVILREEEASAKIAVSDTGSGISTRALPRIFERFYRADTGRARGIGGTGLGLAIVRHLVDSMGGDVEAESELGHGTTIRISLPAGSAGPAGPHEPPRSGGL